MTNEEAMSILSDMSWKDDIDGWVISDKEHKAICIAMKAIENQDKYERALAVAMHDTRLSIQQAANNLKSMINTDSRWCDDHCKYKGEGETRCDDCGVKYYKRKAGIGGNMNGRTRD